MNTQGKAKRIWAGAAIIVGVWTAVGLFYASRAFVFALVEPDYAAKAHHALIGNLADAYTWALFTPAILVLTARFPFRRGSWVRALFVHLAAGAVFATLGVAVNVQVAAWLRPEESMMFGRYFAATFHWNVQWYWMVVGIAYAIDYYRRYRDRELRASRLETQLAHAQVQALKMQLQPHFLFNTLHAVSELVHENPDAADRMITRLGDLLRISIDAASTQQISLEQELEFLSAYLEIERMRFGDRLAVQMDISPDTLDARVPNLLLQPLVENAIRHGTAARAAPGKIEVRAKRNNGVLQIVVRDNGQGLPPGGSTREGVGLRNTRVRLEQLYGTEHYFGLRNSPEGGAVATVVIPFHPAGTPAPSFTGTDNEASHAGR